MEKQKTIAEAGKCERIHKEIPVLYEVVNGLVVSVSCKHETCRWKKTCELYQKHPLGSVVD